MVTVQIEYTFDDYEVEEYLDSNGLEEDDFEDNLEDFVIERLGIYADSVRLL